MGHPQLYGTDYRRRRAQLFATLNEHSTCWRCGEGPREGDPFEAGHLIDGDPHSPLGFEHRTCNRRAGAQAAWHATQPEQHSRQWT